MRVVNRKGTAIPPGTSSLATGQSCYFFAFANCVLAWSESIQQLTAEGARNTSKLQTGEQTDSEGDDEQIEEPDVFSESSSD